MVSLDPTSPTISAVRTHGVNISKSHRWSGSQPFTNRFRLATIFSEHDSGTGARVSDYLVDPRADGYPNTLGAGRYARAYCCGNAVATPVGVWVCAWDGGGTVKFDTANGSTTNASGRIERTITSNEAGEAFLVEIQSTPVTNVRVYYKPYEVYLPGGVTRGFDPDWFARMFRAKYNAVRFLNFLEPNDSVIQVLADKKPEGYYTESNVDYRQDSTLPNIVHRGCTFGFIIEVAQLLQLKRVQVQIPRLTWLDTGHTYIRAMVDALLAGLPSDCIIEIENTNETPWNGGFQDQDFFVDAGVLGLPNNVGTIFAARQNGTDFDKGVQAMGHRCEEIFRIAREHAGAQANRIKRTIAWQATNVTPDFFRFLTHTGQDSDVPFAFDHFSTSGYYANQLPGARVHTLTGVSGTFQIRERVTGTTGSGTLGYIKGNKYFLEDGEILTGTMTGQSSGATGTITGSTISSDEIESWTPADFYAYAQHDLNTRVFGPVIGMQASALLAASRNATYQPYEVGKHEAPTTYNGYSNNAENAILAWYRDPLHFIHISDLLLRIRSIPTSEGHGYWYNEGGEFDWSPWETYLDFGNGQVTADGMNTEAAYLAIEAAGTVLLGGGGGGQNRPPVVTNPGTLQWDEGYSSVYQLLATDPDGDTITWSVSGLPAGRIVNSDGLISGVVAVGAGRTQPYTVTAVANDGRGGSTPMAFNVVVPYNGGGGGTNYPPVIQHPGILMARVGQYFQYQVRWTDPNLQDTHVVTWDANLPPGLTGSTGGLITGTVTQGSSPGDYTPTVTVTDNGTPPLHDDLTFTIRVEAGQGNPNIGIRLVPGQTKEKIAKMLREFYRPL